MKFDTDLDQFVRAFLGYGNLASKIWFVGMEEGGGHNREEIELRIKSWNELSRPSVTDIVEFHKKIGQAHYFEGPAKIQKTWSQLIKFILSSSGLPTDKETVRDFQKNSFCRSNSNHATLELMPLPSPGLLRWYYNEFSFLPYLKTRATYFAELLQHRINIFKEQIRTHRPEVVVFYGNDYLDHWREICETELVCDENFNFYRGMQNNINFAVLKHPVARLPKNYYELIAKSISKNLNE